MWLPHSSLGFQCPVARRSYKLTPQATITQSTIGSKNMLTNCALKPDATDLTGTGDRSVNDISETYFYINVI